jgi:hypothetical protein
MLSLLALAALVPVALAQTHYGCYADVPAGTLTGDSLVNYTTMSIAECETHCTGFDLWAVEYGGEWYVLTASPLHSTNRFPFILHPSPFTTS